MKSLAVVFTAPHEVTFQEVDCPDPGPDDVVVKIIYSWISNGTEGSFLRGERITGETPFRKGDPLPFPIVAGYQKTGKVIWVGSNISDVKIGELVFATVGKVNGMFMPAGGHVSPTVAPRAQIWKLPPYPEPLAFSGMVLTQVGYNCGSRAPIEVGEGAIVIGDGLVGQWAAQTLAWKGARVVIVGRHNERLAKFARSYGHLTVNASRQGAGEDWPDQVRVMFPQGARVAVDTVGSIASLDRITDLLSRYGHIVSAGFYGTEDLLSLQALRSRELSVDLVSGWQKDRMDRTCELIAAGYLETLPLITHHFPVSEAAEAWSLIQAKLEGALGVILDWEDVG